MSKPENEFNPACKDCMWYQASQEALQECQKERSEAWETLERGRDWLMTVEADQISVNDALEAFGFTRDGLGWRNEN